MKKIYFLFFTLSLMKSQFCPASTFDFDLATDHIVGHLWRGTPVPTKEIEKMFQSMKKPKTLFNKTNENSLLNEEDSCVAAFYELALEKLQDEKNEEKKRNIKAFLEEVLKFHVDPQTLENALSVIMEKYY